MLSRITAASISAFLMAASTFADASEGLKYAAAYTCDPARVTRAAVETCAKKFPNHSSKYWSEYHAWLERNGTEILRLRTECASELKKVGADDAQVRDMMRQVDALNTETIAAMSKRDTESTEGLCINLLSGMETRSSDLSRYFPAKN